MAGDESDTEADDDAENGEVYGQNQYGGGSGEIDAAEQTERMEDDEADGA